MTDGAEPSSKVSNAGTKGRGHRLFVLMVFLVPVVLGIGAWRVLTGDVGSNRHDRSALSTTAIPAAEASQHHPLWPAIQFAKQVQKNFDENVHDYTATLIKQERIAGQLTPEEICFVKIRNQPFSVYMDFLSPADKKGQEAIYVDGAERRQVSRPCGHTAEIVPRFRLD